MNFLEDKPDDKVIRTVSKSSVESTSVRFSTSWELLKNYRVENYDKQQDNFLVKLPELFTKNAVLTSFWEDNVQSDNAGQKRHITPIMWRAYEGGLD